MKRASVTEAKNRLSAFIDRVRHGETVIIEDRGIPVAQLSPVSARSAGHDDGRIARLERLGILRPPIAITRSKLLEAPPPGPKLRVSLSQVTIEERRSGR